MNDVINWEEEGGQATIDHHLGTNGVDSLEVMNLMEKEEFSQIGKTVTGSLLIKQVYYGVTSTDKPFTKLTMTNGSSDVVGFIWGEEVEVEGNCIEFRATPKMYEGKTNLTIHSFDIFSVEESMMPSKVDIVHIINELEKYRGVSDKDFKTIMDVLIFNDKSMDNPFFTAPAAIYYHHNYRHGLAEHTLEVVKSAHALAYINGLNIDLTVTGAMLHDIGKIKMYKMNSLEPVYDEFYSTREHLITGLNLIEDTVRTHLPNMDKRKLDLLTHIILSHHGTLDLGAVVEPMFREAQIVHLADGASARLNNFNIMSDENEDKYIRSRMNGKMKTIMNNNYVGEVMKGNIQINGN